LFYIIVNQVGDGLSRVVSFEYIASSNTSAPASTVLRFVGYATTSIIVDAPFLVISSFNFFDSIGVLYERLLKTWIHASLVTMLVWG
jgi:hypothetical protein